MPGLNETGDDIDNYKDDEDMVVDMSEAYTSVTFGDVVLNEQPIEELPMDPPDPEDPELEYDYSQDETVCGSPEYDPDKVALPKENCGSVIERLETIEHNISEILRIVKVDLPVLFKKANPKCKKPARKKKSAPKTTGNPPGRPARKEPKLPVPPKKARKPATKKQPPSKTKVVKKKTPNKPKRK